LKQIEAVHALQRTETAIAMACKGISSAGAPGI
jgi:hypothetical protein